LLRLRARPGAKQQEWPVLDNGLPNPRAAAVSAVEGGAFYGAVHMACLSSCQAAGHGDACQGQRPETAGRSPWSLVYKAVSSMR